MLFQYDSGYYVADGLCFSCVSTGMPFVRVILMLIKGVLVCCLCVCVFVLSVMVCCVSVFLFVVAMRLRCMSLILF